MKTRITLYCIPHAGGGASAFRGWAEAMAPTVTVKVLQLGGRESRFRDPPLTEIDDVLADLRGQMDDDRDGPYAFFGHSLGALLAFELTHLLRHDTGAAASHLFVSACRAPHLRQEKKPFSDTPDDEFIAEITRRYGGIPAPILADAGYMAAVLPALRADIKVFECYRAADRPPLGCPISAFSGRDDTIVSPSEIDAWRHYTTATFSLDSVEGGHFYLQSQRRFLIKRLVKLLPTD